MKFESTPPPNVNAEASDTTPLPKADQNRYHVHIDADSINPTAMKVINTYFDPDYFLTSAHMAEIYEDQLAPLGYSHDFAVTTNPPKLHFSINEEMEQTRDGKIAQAQKLRTALSAIDDQLRAGNLHAYREIETVLKYEKFLSSGYKDFDDTVPLPFKELSFREPDPKKEADVHLSLPVSTTDSRLAQKLAALGMYVVFTPEKNDPDHVKSVVLTLQGSKEHINAITKGLLEYLPNAGGYGLGAKLQVEYINLNESEKGTDLYPPVIDGIT